MHSVGVVHRDLNPANVFFHFEVPPTEVQQDQQMQD